jgi:hypothetical protein
MEVEEFLKGITTSDAAGDAIERAAESVGHGRYWLEVV